MLLFQVDSVSLVKIEQSIFHIYETLKVFKKKAVALILLDLAINDVHEVKGGLFRGDFLLVQLL